jgi:hypothetical protein
MSIRTITSEFTRPSDTNAYTAGDSVTDSTSAPTVRTFASAFRSLVPKGRVLSALLIKSDKSVSNATFRLHLFNATVTPTNDNSALSILYTDRAKYIGHIAFTCKQTQGSGDAAFAVGCVADSTNNQRIDLPFVGANNTLYGVLEATGAYTPVSAEKFSIQLTVEELPD